MAGSWEFKTLPAWKGLGESHPGVQWGPPPSALWDAEHLLRPDSGQVAGSRPGGFLLSPWRHATAVAMSMGAGHVSIGGKEEI